MVTFAKNKMGSKPPPEPPAPKHPYTFVGLLNLSRVQEKVVLSGNQPPLPSPWQLGSGDILAIVREAFQVREINKGLGDKNGSADRWKGPLEG